ncbi:MAG TPA: hypothetical protein VK642_09625 [Burkholderiales bacterium]|nr:hypothetical protein [Burkholderiales bacterium]
MSAVQETYHPRRDGVTIPAIALWIVLSILVHLALLLWMPRMRMQSSEKPEPPPMTVFLQPKPQRALPPELAPAPPPVVARPPQRQPTPRTAKVPPPVIALNKPTPAEPLFVPAPRPEAVPAPAPNVTPPPAETDLAAYIEARRRARGESPDSAAAEADRANRGALASAALKPSAPLNIESQKQTPSGGVFQIRRRGYDYAEFMFYGWNENFRRQGPQLIEVRKDTNKDIDIAVIRKIIELIRNYERGDFTWYSERTRKTLTLSARARDNAGLEDFMMQEFSEELHRYR